MTALLLLPIAVFAEQDAQRLRPQVQRQFSDFVQKDGTAMGEFTTGPARRQIAPA